MGRGIIAHTSPVYIAVGGEWWMFDPETANYMLTLIEGGLSYIQQTARHHEHGTVTHHHGEDDHLEFSLVRSKKHVRQSIVGCINWGFRIKVVGIFRMP